MELPKDNRPDMASFTASRDISLMAADGSHSVIFEAGESKRIRKELFVVAVAAGLMPDEALENIAPPVVKKVSKEERLDTGLLEACKTLILKANPDDFTVVGQPRAASVKKLVDFEFTTKDVERAFSEAVHEVEQYGDDSKEHSEPSSVAAE